MGGAFPKWEGAILRVGFSAESAKSKPEPFLHEPKKKFGTREFQRRFGEVCCIAEGLSTRLIHFYFLSYLFLCRYRPKGSPSSFFTTVLHRPV